MHMDTQQYHQNIVLHKYVIYACMEIHKIISELHQEYMHVHV